MQCMHRSFHLLDITALDHAFTLHVHSTVNVNATPSIILCDLVRQYATWLPSTEAKARLVVLKSSLNLHLEKKIHIESLEKHSTF